MKCNKTVIQMAMQGFLHHPWVSVIHTRDLSQISVNINMGNIHELYSIREVKYKPEHWETYFACLLRTLSVSHSLYLCRHTSCSEVKNILLLVAVLRNNLCSSLLMYILKATGYANRLFERQKWVVIRPYIL